MPVALFTPDVLLSVMWAIIAVCSGRLLLTVVIFCKRLGAEDRDLRLSQHILAQLPSEQAAAILKSLQESQS